MNNAFEFTNELDLQILMKVLNERSRADRNMWCCPDCGGHYYGSILGQGPFIRTCSDEFGIGCRWKGDPEYSASETPAKKLLNRLFEHWANEKGVSMGFAELNRNGMTDGN